MKRTFLSSAAVLVLGFSLGGCESMGPKVDVSPVQPVRYAIAPAAQAVPTGSLFSAHAYRPAFEDPRARLPGDTLTIQIVENVTASQKSSSTINRSADLSSSVNALPFLKPTATPFRLTGEAESKNNFSGKGGTESANRFEGVITATVMEVLPNGHLLVAGEKQIGVNENVDVMRFSGTVDPRQIRPGNVVTSTQVANARIESKNRGAQGEVQAIGWLARFFLSVLPL